MSRGFLRLVCGGLLLLTAQVNAESPPLFNPPAILLANGFHAGINPADYWISEKYDGVRAIWDGRELRFRSGRRVPAPDWFTTALPPQALDGELWLGRGRFDELSALVRQAEPDDAAWRQVRYLIFELPDAPGSFTERIARMQDIVAGARHPALVAVAQFRLPDRQSLQQRLKEIVAAGGEGLMLHRADAPYRAGRSDDLIKLKPLQDAEAVVVGHVPGRGRLQGQTGALVMEMPGGQRFRLGSGLTDKERQQPPAIGSRVSYRYQELTARGVPRFPRYWRLRDDP